MISSLLFEEVDRVNIVSEYLLEFLKGHNVDLLLVFFLIFVVVFVVKFVFLILIIEATSILFLVLAIGILAIRFDD